MYRFRLYLETSLFGFYDDVRPENRSRTDATRTLFTQVKDGLFHGLVSPLVLSELHKAPPPHSEKMIGLIAKHGVEVMYADETLVADLSRKYLADRIVPPEFENDARHVAGAILLGADILVSLNLRHLANEWSMRRFNAVNMREGLPPLIIRSPEEVVRHGD